MFTKKTRVILDTNTLLLPGKGIDIFNLIDQALQEPYKLYTFEGVQQELLTLMQTKGEKGFNAKLGYILAKQKALKTLPCSTEKHVDDVIVDKTTKKDVVVTQDKHLIKRLRERGTRVLRYQQKKLVYQ